MAKQHLTADGWRPCTDTTGRCPYDTHRESATPSTPVDDVEARMSLLDQPKGEQTIEYRPSTSFPAEYLETAENLVAKANRKLEKYDIAERFTYNVEHEIRQENGVNVDYVKFTLSKPVLKTEGWEFIAAHEFTPNGDATSRFITEEALNAAKPVDQRCEHCGRPRHRERVYWVKNSENGEIKQVGSSCLKGFLGVTPKGLWALGQDLDFDEKFTTGGTSASRLYPTNELVAAAYAAMDEDGGQFTPRSRATRENPATADRVRMNWQDYTSANADGVYNDQVQELLSWAETIPEDDDTAYMRDLRTTLTQPWVKDKHVAVALSGISTMAAEARRKQAQAERDAERAKLKNEYFAPEGAKLSGVRAKVVSTYNYTVDTPGGARSATQYVMQSDDGYTFMWRTSADYDFRKGDECVITSGTVKANNEYNGIKQTVLTRAKLQPVEQPQLVNA